MWGWHRKSIPTITRVMDVCPLLGIVSDRQTIYTKDGILAQVIEVPGRDYIGVTEETLMDLYNVRKTMFEHCADYVISIHSLRSEYSPAAKHHQYGNAISQGVIKAWEASFRQTYRTRHFIVVRTRGGEILNRMVKGLERGGQMTDAERRAHLTEFCIQVTARFSAFRARVLNGDALASFWAWLINGQYAPVVMPENLVFDDLLVSRDVYFPSGARHMEYHGNTTRYAAWLAIAQYSTETMTRVLDGLFQVPGEFSLVQSFDVFEKQAALAFLDDKIKHNVAWTSYGQEILNELNEIINAVQSDRVQICRHRFALQVFADSPTVLETAVKGMTAAVEANGILVKRETQAIEPLYWSQYPGLEPFSVRERVITTANLADLVTFSALGEGIDRCSWGPWPTAVFKTLGGSEYSFTFHKTEVDLELGHTLIIGGSNSGKTTLISFLMTNALKYPGMKILNFDRLQGMEVATRLQGGIYIDFQGEPLMNPLHLSDNPVNRTFLNTFLCWLSGTSSDTDKQLIADAIDSSYSLAKEDRTLAGLQLAFGLKDEDSVMAGMEKWLPGGAYGHYFTGKKDSLNFDNPIVTFDMSSVMTMPEVLGPMALYLFHRLEMSIHENPSPFLLFIDEFRNYLAAPAFAEQFTKAAQEYRKLNGVVVAAMQDAAHIYKDEIGRQSLNNFGTYILYPAINADEAAYQQGFGLTHAEFQWIRQSHPRQVMIKRREGESTILNIDLSPLGRHLKIYDSAATAAQRANTLRKAYSSDWRQRFLGEEGIGAAG